MYLVKKIETPFGFQAKEGDYGIEKSIDLNPIVGIPFEVPDELAQARILASPNVYREAVKEDFDFAKGFVEHEKEKLEELIPEIPVSGEFDVLAFLEGGVTQERLSILTQPELYKIALELEINTPKNTGIPKLIEKILEKTQ